MKCESCGMPMIKAEDHGLGRIDNKYCRFCTNDEGNLKHREEVRMGWIEFAMRTEGISRSEAVKKVDEQMKKMPAWRK